MLDNLNLVHMNGRVYDQIIGRFLSADPFIDGPGSTQGWNRYSYVHNNPLSYIDPFGFEKSVLSWIGDAIKAAAGLMRGVFVFVFTFGNNNSNNQSDDGSANGGSAADGAGGGGGGGGGGNGNGGRSGFYGGGVGVHVPGAAPGDMDNVGRGTSGGDRVHGPGQSDQTEVQVRVPAEDTISTVGGSQLRGIPCESAATCNMTRMELGYLSGEVSEEQLQDLYDTNGGAGLTFAPVPPIARGIQAFRAWRAARALRALRQQYVSAVEALAARVPGMRQAGMTSEQIARALHAERRTLGVQFKALTPADKLAEITQRNIQRYGDPLGPSVDWLRAQGKTWEQIIESASRAGGRDLGL
jgi:RHS repeat-associated protein